MLKTVEPNKICDILTGKQPLYHGTTYDIPKIEIEQCRKHTDFGQGFYLTTSLTQAKDWAVRQYKNLKKYKKANAQMSNYIQKNLIQLGVPVIIPYKININKSTQNVILFSDNKEFERLINCRGITNITLSPNNVVDKNKLNIKPFETNSPEWALFVLNNRNINFVDKSSLKYNGDAKYDIVIGPVADGNIDETLEEYKKEKYANGLNKSKLQEFASDLTYRNKYNDQCSFHTDKAINLLTKGDLIYLKVNKVYRESGNFSFEEYSIFENLVRLIVKKVLFLMIENGYSKLKAENLFTKSKTYELLQDMETEFYKEDSYFIYGLLKDEIECGHIIQREF